MEEECRSTEEEHDIFFDTVLAPRRRRHRRLRKRQRARIRRNNRVVFKVFRRAQRRLQISEQTGSVTIQTQPKLNNRTRDTQTQCKTADSGNTSAMEKEERVQVDAKVQTQPVCCKEMASQCNGLVGSAGEMAETETLREIHLKLGIAKGGYDDLQYELKQVLEEYKCLQWLLEQEKGGVTAEEPPVPSRLDNNNSCEDVSTTILAGYTYVSDE